MTRTVPAAPPPAGRSPSWWHRRASDIRRVALSDKSTADQWTRFINAAKFWELSVHSGPTKEQA